MTEHKKKTEKKTEAKAEPAKEPRLKWIYLVGNDEDDRPIVVGKKRVQASYQCDEAKGEFDKYTDGARDAVIAALTVRMDKLRDFRHKQYVRAAKSLPVVE